MVSSHLALGCKEVSPVIDHLPRITLWFDAWSPITQSLASLIPSEEGGVVLLDALRAVEAGADGHNNIFLKAFLH